MQKIDLDSLLIIKARILNPISVEIVRRKRTIYLLRNLGRPKKERIILDF